MKFLVFIFSALFLISCSSTPVVPEAKNVKLSREKAADDCKDLGPVEGTVQTKGGFIDAAIENMKLDAARKGANYIQMETTSAYGTTTRGTAYFCP